MVVVFTAKRVAQTFGAAVVCLVAAHVIVQVARFAMGDDRLFGLVTLLSLGSESNLPTFYASTAILFCALLLSLIGFMTWHSERRWSIYWFLLAFVFMFLALDEFAEIHERLSDPTRNLLGTGGLLHYAWVIPYGIGLIIFALAYIRFLVHIPRRTAALFIVAGGLFVTGAIGVELIGGIVFQEFGSLNVLYVVVQSLEEILEMSGIIIFIYALVDYIEKSHGEVTLIIGKN